MLPTAFQTNKATGAHVRRAQSPTLTVETRPSPFRQTHKWPSLPCPGNRRVVSRELCCLNSAHVQRRKGGPPEMPTEQARDGAEWLPPTTVLDSKLQPTKRAARLTRLQTHRLHWRFSQLLLATSGWRWAPSVGLGWGPHRCYAVERQRQRPRK